MPNPGLPKIKESKTEMVRTHGENVLGRAVEANYAGGDAGEEAERKTAYQMERCDPKSSGGKWTVLRGGCCGGPEP